MEALEQILQPMYSNGIDLYAAGTVGLYSGPKLPEPTIQPLGGNPANPNAIIWEPGYLNGGQERFRLPETHGNYGYHTNYEVTLPGIKKPLTNVHIDLEPWKG